MTAPFLWPPWGNRVHKLIGTHMTPYTHTHTQKESFLIDEGARKRRYNIWGLLLSSPVYRLIHRISFAPIVRVTYEGAKRLMRLRENGSALGCWKTQLSIPFPPVDRLKLLTKSTPTDRGSCRPSVEKYFPSSLSLMFHPSLISRLYNSCLWAFLTILILQAHSSIPTPRPSSGSVSPTGRAALAAPWALARVFHHTQAAACQPMWTFCPTDTLSHCSGRGGGGMHDPSLRRPVFKVGLNLSSGFPAKPTRQGNDNKPWKMTLRSSAGVEHGSALISPKTISAWTVSVQLCCLMKEKSHLIWL